jgi:hypothetical protein
MILRAAAVWLLLLVIAVAVGSGRVGLLEPLVGERTGHQLGTVAVVVLFGAAIWLIVPWIEPGLDRGRLIALGIGWAVATVLFELSFGHWVAGHPWSRLLADYDLLGGRLWVLVLLTVLVGPAVAGALRQAGGK